MVNKNIQIKKKNNGEWDNLFPLTFNENVFNEEGQDLNVQLEKMNNEIDDIPRLKHLFYAKDLEMFSGDDITVLLKKALNTLPKHSTLVFDSSAKYFISETIETKNSINLEGNGSTLITNYSKGSNQGEVLIFSGTHKDTTVVNRNYSEGEYSLQVSSTVNVEKGDLIHIKSPELFNSSRLYYRKGGVFKVIEVDKINNKIKIDMSMPFNFSAGAEVLIYSPVTVNINNLKIKNIGEVDVNTVGITLKYAVDSKITKMSGEYFNNILRLRYHHNTIVEQFNAGESFFDNTSESYCVLSFTGTQLTVRNSTLNKGVHGLSINGFEPSYRSLVENCSFDANDERFGGLDMHGANHDSLIVNSHINGASINGNVTFLKCTFTEHENDNGRIRIAPYDEAKHANYHFLSCTFAGNKNRLYIDSYRANTAGSNDKIGSVVFENANVVTGLNVDFRTTIDITIDRIKISDVTQLSMIYDVYIKSLIVTNCHNIERANFLEQVSAKTIEKIIIRDCTMTSGYNALILKDFRDLLIDNCRMKPTGSPGSRIFFETVNGTLANIVIQNSFINPGIGTFSYKNINKLTLINTDEVGGLGPNVIERRRVTWNID